MNFDDILGKLLPLFEQKMAWNMEKEKRNLSLSERTDERKLDLEYRKLENQLTNDKDKLAWEKEKLTTTIKGNMDMKTLESSGMLDLERLKQLGDKDKQKILAESEKYKVDMTTLGTILGHAQNISQTGADGITKTSNPTKEVTTAANALMERANLVPATAAPQARNVAGEAENALVILANHEKNKTPDQAKTFYRGLPADVRAIIDAQPKGAAAPGVTPGVPASADRAPIVPIQPDANPVNAYPTTGSVFQQAGEGVRSFVDTGNRLSTGAEKAILSAPRTAVDTVQGAAQGAGTAIAGAGREFMVGYDPAAEKKRREEQIALRRAKGLTGGFGAGGTF
jgi:hypothetical protein